MSDNPRVWIAQLKCPNNHTIMGAAAVCSDGGAAERLRSQLLANFAYAVAVGVFNPKCGLCNATAFHVDLGATKYATMEEAEAPLMEMERANMETALMMRGRQN